MIARLLRYVYEAGRMVAILTAASFLLIGVMALIIWAFSGLAVITPPITPWLAAMGLWLLATVHEAFAWASRHEVFVALIFVWTAINRCSWHVTSAINRAAIRQAAASEAVERQLAEIIRRLEAAQ